MKHGKWHTRVHYARIGVVVIPLVICGLIFLTICLKYIAPLILVRVLDLNEIRVVSDQTEISLLLTIVGIAVSVWIGLNIYNIACQKDMEQIIADAKEAQHQSERVLMETLVSKLRLSYNDRTAQYYAERFERSVYYSQEVVQELIEIEDMYRFAYTDYKEKIYSDIYVRGQRKTEHFAEYLENKWKESEERRLLLSYAYMRYGDFLYFNVQCSACNQTAERVAMRDKAILAYKRTLKYQFNIRATSQFGSPELYSTVEKECIAFLTNSIGSLYLLTEETGEKIVEAIQYLDVACAFSDQMNSKFRALFFRNRGVAKSLHGEMTVDSGSIFEDYRQAYQLNPGNAKTSHCLGSWYRKEASRRFGLTDPKMEAPVERGTLTEEQLETARQYYRKSLYWYLNEYRLSGDLMDIWIERICRVLQELGDPETGFSTQKVCAFLGKRKEVMDDILLGMKTPDKITDKSNRENKIK